jgi:methionyl-tRNA formyltransferase
MSKSKLVFFGNQKLATGVQTDAPLQPALTDAGYQIVSSVTGDIPDDLADSEAEAAVLVAYGQIIPQAVIDLFPKGIINIHPSLLPLYRGPTPIEAAILDGAKETGVSLMRLSAKMDAGPVYVQQRLPLTGSETKQELAGQLLRIGQKLLLEHLPAILEGWQTPKPQNDSNASYTKLLKKDDGKIDWQKPADQIERQVRAYAGWPRSQAKIFDKEVIITKARLAKDKKDGKLVIKCQPGYLEVEELIAPSGRTMSGADFIRGYNKN